MSTRTRSTNSSDGVVAIQPQLNNLGKEIKKVNKKGYAAQVECESCNGPHYTKDCQIHEEEKTIEEAYYTQFGVPFPQEGRYRVAALGFYQRDNVNPSYQERRQTMEESLSKFMTEFAKRHDENSNLIKEIRATMDAAIQNQGASIKVFEIQIGQMSKTDTAYSDKLNMAYGLPDTTIETDSSYLIFVLDLLYNLSSEQILLIFLPLLQIVLIKVSRLKK
nr:hypothetical protein [Tanacetum cinerariifolium]